MVNKFLMSRTSRLLVASALAVASLSAFAARPRPGDPPIPPRDNTPAPPPNGTAPVVVVPAPPVSPR